MKLKAHLKIVLKSIIRELPVFVLTFAVYPLLLALIMGYLQEDQFTPTISKPLFSIAIADEENSPESMGLAAFLRSEEIARLLTVVDQTKRHDYVVRIPRGYSASLIGRAEAAVQVEIEAGVSVSPAAALADIIDRYNGEISRAAVIQDKFESLGLPQEDKEQLKIELAAAFSRVQMKNAIETHYHDVKKGLNSFEYYSASMITFVFVMILLAVINSDALEREIELHHRILSTPNSRLACFNYNFAGNYLQVIVASLIYVGVYRISGLSFQGPLVPLLLILLVQALVVTALSTLISNSFGKQTGTNLLQAYLIFQVIFGGTIGPLHEWSDQPIFAFLIRYKPDKLITDSYTNYILHGTFGSIAGSLLAMLGVAGVFYLGSVFMMRMKWGENR